jgi:Protein of unknown function (DUF1488)
MPLVRSQEDFEILQFERVHFWMEVGAKRVLCKVSHVALSERAIRDGLNLEEGPAFKRYRDEIERVASQKYDLGKIGKNGSIVITDYDLVPHLAGTTS